MRFKSGFRVTELTLATVLSAASDRGGNAMDFE
jgi:hypothetical protein